MTFEQLSEIGQTALADVEATPAGLPAPLVYVLFSEQGQVYTVVNDEFLPVIQALRDAHDTIIRACLAMWKDVGTDLPSYEFRTALRRLNPANNDTELCLGNTSKPLLATMKHPKFDMLSLKEYPELLDRVAVWFHEKWNIPEGAYRESMENSLRTDGPVPRWYVMLDGETIIAGLGVIENDFHLRRDLTPNVCAVYVEEEYRKQGLSGQLLTHACNKYASMGIHTLYLATEHTSFYERYGWEFHCMAQEEDSDHMTRMYRKTTL